MQTCGVVSVAIVFAACAYAARNGFLVSSVRSPPPPPSPPRLDHHHVGGRPYYQDGYLSVENPYNEGIHSTTYGQTVDITLKIVNTCSGVPKTYNGIKISRGCYVPQTMNGDLKKEIPGFHRMNFSTFNFERTLADENVQVGSFKPLGAELFLFCHDGYYLQGRKRTEAPIMCLDGSWTPDPVCLRNGAQYISTNRKTPFPTDSPVSEDECSCEYKLDSTHIIAYSGGKLVRLNDRVNNGSSLKFRCAKIGYHQLLGPQEVQCENCQSWNITDFPTCTRPESGDAMIFLDKTVNVSLEGVLKVQRGKPLRLVCSVMETEKFPTWNVPNVAGINLTEEILERRKDIHLYVSHLDIEKIIPEDGGSYSCSLDQMGRSAEVQVQVVET